MSSRIYNVGVIGASGRMGQELLAILKEKKISAISFSQSTSPVDQVTAKGLDLLIDFSSPKGFDEALKTSVALKIPLISGTTGLSAKQKQALRQASRKIAVLWSPNMSLGIALMKKAMGLFAQLKGFDFQIEEAHHSKKKDRPSGTALLLQETLTASLPQKVKLPEPLVARLGGIIGIHKVYAVSEEELICFEHQALTRKVFAAGAIRAGEWIIKQKPGLYVMEDLFNA